MSWLAILGFFGGLVTFSLGMEMAEEGTAHPVGVGIMIAGAASMVAAMRWGIL